MQQIQQAIRGGQTALGIELGSTRIKAVLIGPDHTPIASGDHTWENRLENGVWTYRLQDVWAGVQAAFVPPWPPTCRPATACRLPLWGRWASPA